MQLAVDEGRHANVAAAIFRAYFERGADIGDSNVLDAASAPRPASPTKTLQAFRETREGDAALVGSEERLRGFGVRTVPNLLFGGRVLVPGTVNVATYVHALDQALFPVERRRQQGNSRRCIERRARLPPFWRQPCRRRYLTAACRRPALKTDLTGHRGRAGPARRRRGARTRCRDLSWPRRCRTFWSGRAAPSRCRRSCKLCHARSQPVVTHGGLTGLVKGADAGRSDIVLSLESMNAIERVDVPGPQPARAGRRAARTRAARGRRTRHGVSARSRRARQRHGRRQHLDQCRRPARAALRDDAQPGAGHRSRPGRRHRAHLAQPHAQEQCRLRPQAAVHRQRRHARRGDARRAAAGVAHAQPGNAAGVAAAVRCHGRSC